jgi:hypothetical protein
MGYLSTLLIAGCAAMVLASLAALSTARRPLVDALREL